jgi:hypothetical protein
MTSNFNPNDSQYDYDWPVQTARNHSRMDSSNDSSQTSDTPSQTPQHGLDFTTYVALRRFPDTNSSALPMLQNSVLFVEWIGSEFALNPYQRNLLRNLHEVTPFITVWIVCLLISTDFLTNGTSTTHCVSRICSWEPRCL